MAKGKKKDFFRSSNLKLNRELAAERKSKSVQKPSGFIKQMRENTRGDLISAELERAEIKAAKTFKGEQVVERTKEIDASFEVDPAKVEANEPNKGFANEMNFERFKKGIK
jgi:hypothetical protein